MISLLTNIFIEKRNYSEDEKRRRYGMLCGIVGICLNIMLFAGKLIAGTISGAISLVADAANNLSDAGASVISLIGFKLAGKKPDRDHPYGHGRSEYIAGMVVSGIIILMGFELLKSSFGKILKPEKIESDIVIILVIIVAICVKIYMFVYNNSVGNRINSSSMKATAMDSLSDTIATSVVLISMIIAMISGINLDGYAGIVVAGFIIYTGINSVKETVGPLLGQAPSEEFVKSINDIVMAHDEIVGIHDLMVHDYGPGRVFISLHGEVSGDGDIFVIHDAIDCIENELSEKLNCEAVIHMDPIDIHDETVNKLRTEVLELVKTVDGSLSIHDFRMISGPTHTNLVFDVLASYDVKKTDAELKEEITIAIMNNWHNYFPVIKIDRKYANG